MISNSLSTSERWAALHNEAGKLAEFCQVLFVLLVSHADDHGRLKGSPFTVKHLVIPTSPRTIESVEHALAHLHNVNLITWYEHEDHKFIQINRFADHQALKGHDKRPSKYPDPPEVAQVRPDSPKPALREVKRREEKGREENLVQTAKEQQSGAASKLPSPAREFLNWFQIEYRARREGGAYFVLWGRHMPIVTRLLTLHSPERLRKHATILLTSNDDWISDTDRGIEVLAAKINWLEERLAAWEAKKKGREAV